MANAGLSDAVPGKKKVTAADLPVTIGEDTPNLVDLDLVLSQRSMKRLEEADPDLHDRLSRYRGLVEAYKKEHPAESASISHTLTFLSSFRGSNGRRLNPQQALFVAHYINEGHLAKAYRAADYSPGLKKNRLRASVMADEATSLVNKVLVVKEAIAECINRRLRRLAINQDEVLLEVYNQALFDPLDVLEPDGTGRFVVRDLNQIPPAARRCIKKMQRTMLPNGQENIVVEFHDKLKMLEMLAKHTGATNDQTKVEVNLNFDRTVELEKARKRAQEAPIETRATGPSAYEVDIDA